MHDSEDSVRIRRRNKCDQFALIRKGQRIEPEEIADALYLRAYGDRAPLEEDSATRRARAQKTQSRARPRRVCACCRFCRRSIQPRRAQAQRRRSLKAA